MAPNITPTKTGKRGKPNNVSPPTKSAKKTKLSKRKKGNASKRKSANSGDTSPTRTNFPGTSISFFHLKNPNLSADAPSCLLIRGNGYMERALSEPFYKRDQNPVYKEFVETLDAYNLVLNPLHPDDGTPMTRPTKNRRPGMPESFNEKVIALQVDNDSTWDGTFKNFFEDTLKPLIDGLYKTKIFNQKPDVQMTDPPVFDVVTWSKMLTTKNILAIINEFYCDEDEDDMPSNVDEFLRMDKENIYAFWMPGNVPVEEVSHHYSLPEEILETEDWNKLVAHRAELELVAKQEDDEAEKEEEDDEEEKEEEDDEEEYVGYLIFNKFVALAFIVVFLANL